MASKNAAATTEQSPTLDAHRTPANFSDNDTAFVDEDSVLVDEEELLFYFALYKVTVPTAFGVIMLVGLLGNLLVVVVTLSRHKMWTTVNLLLLNLAVTDVIFVIICVPFMAYHYAADNWLIGDVVCKLSQFFLYVTVYVTVTSASTSLCTRSSPSPSSGIVAGRNYFSAQQLQVTN